MTNPSDDKRRTDNRAKAFLLVNKVSDQSERSLSNAQVATLVNAVEADFTASDAQAQLDDERLTKLETQTHALAEAVIAIAEPGDTVAPAVRTVKDGM